MITGANTPYENERSIQPVAIRGLISLIPVLGPLKHLPARGSRGKLVWSLGTRVLRRHSQRPAKPPSELFRIESAMFGDLGSRVVRGKPMERE